MTVGRSEQAKTLVVERERKVLNTVGWCPESPSYGRSTGLQKEQRQEKNRNKQDRQLDCEEFESCTLKLSTRQLQHPGFSKAPLT